MSYWRDFGPGTVYAELVLVCLLNVVLWGWVEPAVDAQFHYYPSGALDV